jgi:hypothetical protein
MTGHAELDVSEQAMHVCVVDGQGRVTFRGVRKTLPSRTLPRAVRGSGPWRPAWFQGSCSIKACLRRWRYRFDRAAI